MTVRSWSPCTSERPELPVGVIGVLPIGDVVKDGGDVGLRRYVEREETLITHDHRDMSASQLG